MNKFKKPYKWRIYADNNIELALVEFLRKKNFDVLWVGEISAWKHRDDVFHYNNAMRLERYLLTRDIDFWNDHRFPIQESPGVLIITTKDISIAKYLPILLRKLVNEAMLLFREHLYLYGFKIKLNFEGIEIKFMDHDLQRINIKKFKWRELF